MIIPKLIIRTDFFGRGFTYKFYDVERADIKMFEGLHYGDPFWFIEVRGKTYKLCPPPSGLIPQARQRARALLADLEKQITAPEEVNK